MKKIFIISLVLLLITLFFLGVYNFAFKKNTPQVAVQENKSTEQTKAAPLTSTPAVTIEKIMPVSDQGVIGAVYDKKNDTLLYYSAQDGTTWKSDSDGKNKTQISKFKISNLKNAIWSSDRTKVLTTINNGGDNKFYEYDTITQKATALKEGLDTAVWDNIGSKIFYKYFDQATKQRSLNIANPDGSGWQKLADINFRNLSISQIPLTSLVSYWNSPNASEETLLQTVGIAAGETKEIFKGRFGADYLWSPNGALALISSLSEKNGKKITLGTIDLNGNFSDLNIPTLVSKCIWSSDNKTVYYALAGAVPEGSQMPNDYQDGKVITKDTFWKLDITTGKKERLVEPEEISGSYDSINLFLSSTEDSLYFVNRVDKKLYKIEL